MLIRFTIALLTLWSLAMGITSNIPAKLESSRIFCECFWNIFCFIPEEAPWSPFKLTNFDEKLIISGISADRDNETVPVNDGFLKKAIICAEDFGGMVDKFMKNWEKIQ